MPIKVKFMFKLDADNAEAVIAAPFIQIKFAADETPTMELTFLKIFKFNKRLRKGKGKNLRKYVHPRDIRLKVYYGFNDPAITGFFPVLAGIASSYAKLERILYYPQFLGNTEYIWIDGTANIKLGKI